MAKAFLTCHPKGYILFLDSIIQSRRIKSMLVLSRRNGESIKIGKDVVVTVLGVRGEKIRLGVDAPKNVDVHRDEVAQMIAEAIVKDESSQAKS